MPKISDPSKVSATVLPLYWARRQRCASREQTGADVDHGDGRACRIQRIENLHLVRSRRHVDDFGDFRMKALQRTAGRFGIEGAGGTLLAPK
jgi:hypothetical protein